MSLTKEDKKNIEAIREEIEKHKLARDLAQGEIEANIARLQVYQRRCDHPDGYETSSMGDRGFKCEDCGYVR